MASSKSSYAPLLLFLSFAFFLVICQSSPQDLKTYIVYTGNSMKDEASALSLYTSMLQQVADSSNNEPKSILHHYKRSFGGFVAMLTEEEAHRMAGLDGVVSVFPNRKNKLLTTRSWDFIGFTQQEQNKADTSNLIIGVLDSGIWPESESFNDRGYNAPPNRWNGQCVGTNFTCNRKIIGARFYRVTNKTFPIGDEERSARDINGHGTHVASIAAGNPVSSASMLGFAQGTARGGATSARIAVYKVCWIDDCQDADILAAFDDAIADGVDIINASIGKVTDTPELYFENAISIGTFHAMRRGVVATVAAGNYGPEASTLINYAPWLISVGASSIDRKFDTKVRLGNGKTYMGVSVSTFDLNGQFYPLIYGQNAPAGGTINGSLSRYCEVGTLNATLIRGKIVVCDGSGDGAGPFYGQAIGVLLVGDDELRDTPSSLPLPGSSLSQKDGDLVLSYMRSTPNLNATINRSVQVGDTLAPSTASFSSRGPNLITPEILKPDLVAPGVAILAAWSPRGPPSGVTGDPRSLAFNIISGTSMAAPHVAGAAMYIKTFHPTWSPAAIRSALMTTTRQVNPTDTNDLEFGYGAGQIDPVKAVNPGLVYDAGESEYIRFLCGQGYSTRQLQNITRDNSTCPSGTQETARDLNYPSFALQATSTNVRGSFKRSVKYVGTANSTFRATVSNPQGLTITVNPSTLSFSFVDQELIFVLTVAGTLSQNQSLASGSLVWSDGRIQVKSPIIVFKK